MTEEIRRTHPFATACSACRASIVWFTTTKGKKMPVDESSTLPTDRADQLDLSRHISHFATCPAAASFRRR